MFTGIIETIGNVKDIVQDNSNIHFAIQADILSELKIDQSISHNGACLTVTKIDSDYYWVTAVEETLKKTNLSELKKGDFVNLERCLKVNGRLDGHLVQGHVDEVGICKSISNLGGSWLITFNFDKKNQNFLIEKGSVCVNGISLTAFDIKPGEFSVAIIPYTFENTIIKYLKVGGKVNLEFDVIGKYLNTIVSNYIKNINLPNNQ